MTEGRYTYPYPRPMLAVDAAVFTVRDGRLDILLIKRGHAPYEGMWALPGGFVDMDEELEPAAARELEEETGVTGVRLEQFHTFGGVDRDPRGRLVTIAYLGVVASDGCNPRAADDAAAAAWMPVANLPRLACDHNLIIATAVDRLRMLARARTGNLGMLPPSIQDEDFARALESVPQV